jgi:ferredoxin
LKVIIDENACTGHGRCYDLAPDVFEADERGNGVVKLAELPVALEPQARTAERNCPERAIRIERGAA